jgi:hypothetical protein
MRYLITLIATLFLLANTSVTLAGGHKSKAPKADKEMTDDAERGGDKNKDKNKEKHGDAEHDHDDKGNEKSQQKRAENEERKQAHEEYKGTREPGQEGKKAKDGEPKRKPK